MMNSRLKKKRFFPPPTQVAECLGEVDGQLKLRIAVKIDFPDLLDATTADYSEAQPPSSPCGVA